MPLFRPSPHSPWRLFALLCLAACAVDLPTDATRSSTAGSANTWDYAYLCSLGYTEYCEYEEQVDPDPYAPGLWLGGLLAPPGNCFATQGGGDEDEDGLQDECETRLAEAFMPLLHFSPQDDVRGERYWIVAPHPTDGGVWIGYLLGYYNDHGCAAGGCEFVGDHIDDHQGDSEIIWVHVEMDPTTHHWVVRKAKLSAHTGYNTHGPGSGGYATGLAWIYQAGGPFEVWVSKWKHANYASDAACDAGGTAGADVCYTGSVAWFDFQPDRNIGSNQHRLKNCVESLDVFAGNGVFNCFWQGSIFTGWQVPDVMVGVSTGYRFRMQDVGLAP